MQVQQIKMEAERQSKALRAEFEEQSAKNDRLVEQSEVLTKRLQTTTDSLQQSLEERQRLERKCCEDMANLEKDHREIQSNFQQKLLSLESQKDEMRGTFDEYNRLKHLLQSTQGSLMTSEALAREKSTRMKAAEDHLSEVLREKQEVERTAEEKLTRCNKDLNGARAALKQAQESSLQQEKVIHSLRLQTSSLRTALSRCHQDLNQTEGALDTEKSKVCTSRQQLDEVHALLRDKAGQIQELQLALSQRAEDCSRLQDRINFLERQKIEHNVNHEDEMRGVAARTSKIVDELQADLRQEKQTMQRKDEQIIQLREELSTACAQRSSCQAQYQHAELELRELRRKCASLTRNLEVKVQAVTSLKHDLECSREVLENQMKILNNEKQQHKDSVLRLSKQLEDATRNLNSATLRENVLQQMVEDLKNESITLRESKRKSEEQLKSHEANPPYAIAELDELKQRLNAHHLELETTKHDLIIHEQSRLLAEQALAQMKAGLKKYEGVSSGTADGNAPAAAPRAASSESECSIYMHTVHESGFWADISTALSRIAAKAFEQTTRTHSSDTAKAPSTEETLESIGAITCGNHLAQDIALEVVQTPPILTG